jgi:putative transcription factor
MDWDAVTVIRKKPSQIKSQAPGVAIAEKKQVGNKKGVDGQRIAKVDRENDVVAIDKVSPTVAKAIQKQRLELKMTQKDLSVKINEKPTIVAEYESAKATPNQQILSKMERVLGIKLRGKDIGEPLRPPKK